MMASHSADAPIVVIGGALADVRAAPSRTARGRTMRRGESVPGSVRVAAGGAARNVAANLARFGRSVVLLTAVGDDALGRWILDETEAAGVDTAHAVRLAHPTATFVTMIVDGDEPWCVSDAGVVEALTAEHVAAWAPMISRAAVVVADANMSESVHHAVRDAAVQSLRVLLTTSPSKAPRLRPVVHGAAIVVGSVAEGRALLTVGDRDGAESAYAVARRDPDWRRVGDALTRAGVAQAILTLGPRGIASVTADDHVHVDALTEPVVDTLGAGDAVAAAVVHGAVACMPVRETLALAARAAAHVARCTEVTPSSLHAVLAS